MILRVHLHNNNIPLVLLKLIKITNRNFSDLADKARDKHREIAIVGCLDCVHRSIADKDCREEVDGGDTGAQQLKNNSPIGRIPLKHYVRIQSAKQN